MSARHRHHKSKIREVERDLEDNAKDREATERVMAYLLAHGQDKISAAYHTLEHVLANLKHDRAALVEIMQVLAPDDWRWRMVERWRLAVP